MALNYSYSPLFPDPISESNLWSPMTTNGLSEGMPDLYGNGYPFQWHSSQGKTKDSYFSFWSDNVYPCHSPESNLEDIVNSLPTDPWGMENYDFLAELNLMLSNALKSQPSSIFSQSFEKLDTGVHSVPIVQCDQKLNDTSKVNNYVETRETESSLAPYNIGNQSVSSEGIAGLSSDRTSFINEVQLNEKVEGAAQSEEAPIKVIKLCLVNLGLKDLLSVGGVCSSLHNEVLSNFFWKSIHIDEPLNEKITDDLLLKLTCRADGDLQCLSLRRCPKITDEVIRHILEANPKLKKLVVLGCKKLSIEGILNNIRIHNSKKDIPGIKQLRVGDYFGILTNEQFKEFEVLLGIVNHEPGSIHKPYFYHRGDFYLPYDDDRALDIERCPKCAKYRLVYDCPAESFHEEPQSCRACKICIPRCAHCGRCIGDNVYEETFCLDLLCVDCSEQFGNYQNRLNKVGVQHEA